MAHTLPLRIGLMVTLLSAGLTAIMMAVAFYLISVVYGLSLFAAHTPIDVTVTAIGVLAAVFIVLLLPTLFLTRLMTRRLFKPLHQLTAKTRSYSLEGQPVSFELDSNDEFSELGKALQDMQEHLSDSHQQIELMAYRDPLTGLPNRRGLFQELRKLIVWARKHESRIALLYIDLDHFKQVNESSGHEQGDQILKEVAQRLLQLISQQISHRLLPFPEDLLLSRPGGDEFAIMLPEIQRVEEAEQLSHHIIKAIQQPLNSDDKSYSLSCSIGITIYPDDANSAERMLKHADIAMYESKKSGRNRVSYFLPAMHRQVEERVAIQQGISLAMAENQLHIEYQPIVNLKNRKIAGAEALLRWHHPKRGRLGPETFIPIIEESDQIGPLTVWIIETVAAELKTLPSLNDTAKLSINISSAILNKPELTRLVDDALKKVDAPNQRICLEITETSLMKDIDNTLPLLNQWKDAGYSIWIDDFGTGYSSLNYLARLPIDGVKIDRSFIRDLHNSRPVIETILALAKTMNLLTVSEGIEELSQQQELNDLGCGFGQGYLYSEPLRIGALRERLDEQIKQEKHQLLPFKRPKDKGKS